MITWCTKSLNFDLRLSYAGQDGFLSIDCGHHGANYTDNNKLNWTGDGAYIQTGRSSGQLFTKSEVGDNQNLRSYRFFPEKRNKHCFELPTPHPEKNSYLFRASFYMDEVVLKDTRPFEFIVSVEGTNWFTVRSGNESQTSLLIVQEGIFYPPGEVSFFCLTPIIGKPFISSLEMRTLDSQNNYIYATWSTQYISLISRYSFGGNSATPDLR
jgi:hypothetical protein